MGVVSICCYYSEFVSSLLLCFGLFAFLDDMQKQLSGYQKAEEFYRVCGKFQTLPKEKLSTCDVPAGIFFPFPFSSAVRAAQEPAPLEPAELA